MLHVHIHILYSTIYFCRHRSCMSFKWCTHQKYMEEKGDLFWLKLKFIVNHSSSISHKFTSASHTQTCILHVHPCLCSFLLPVDGSPRGPWGKDLCAPKSCFSPHYCQGIHWWLMIDYISASAQGFPSACDLQQLRALVALAATLT